jgi:hypothetical protein
MKTPDLERLMKKVFSKEERDFAENILKFLDRENGKKTDEEIPHCDCFGPTGLCYFHCNP